MKALGRAIASGYKIRRSPINPERFIITSPRGGMYVTTVDECSCPDKRMRGGSYERGGKRYCKHSLIIQQLVEFLKEVA